MSGDIILMDVIEISNLTDFNEQAARLANELMDEWVAARSGDGFDYRDALQAAEMRLLDSLSLTEQAAIADDRLRGYARETEALWYRISSWLMPFKERELWRYVTPDESDSGAGYYKSWQDYCDRRLGQRDTSINNYLAPYRKLIEAGQNPADYAEVPQSRVSELADVAAYKGERWSEDEKRQLIEAGKTRKPRGEDDPLSIAAREARTMMRRESLVRRTFRFAESQAMQHDVAMKGMNRIVEKELGKSKNGAYTNEMLYEYMLAKYVYPDPEFAEALGELGVEIDDLIAGSNQQ